MSDSTLVAGIDSSTQSVKILLVDAADGTVVDESSAPHPGGSEVDPAAWWTALQAADTGLLRRAAAIGVAGQQHGMVCLDEAGAVVRPALLWNDLRSARRDRRPSSSISAGPSGAPTPSARYPRRRSR